MQTAQISLPEQLNQKIDTLVHAYEHLKSENQMLRDELQVSKNRLQEQQTKLLDYDDSINIKESELETIITKLELALGNQ